MFEGKYVVREDDDFVVPFLVIFDEKLGGPELVRVHHTK